VLIELVESVATVSHLLILPPLNGLALANLDLVDHVVNLSALDTTLTMPDLIMLLTAEGLLKN
jgi:hypothetical protein